MTLRYLLLSALGILLLMPTLSAKEHYLVFHINSSSKSNAPGSGFVCVVEKTPEGDKVVGKYPTLYGLRGYPKKVLGDKKTPLGMYLVKGTAKKSMDTRTASYAKFGGYSIHINYPNWHDKRLDKTGSAITIHGGRARNTLGCPRVLDGTLSQPRFGKENIAKIAKIAKNWRTHVFIIENCPKELLAEEGQYISQDASNFFSSMMKSPPSPKGLKLAIEKFRQETYEMLVSSSSILNNSEDYTYWNLLDQNPATAWVPNPAETKPWISYTFDNTKEIRSLKIVNGYNKMVGNTDRWLQNARIKKIKLIFDNEKSLELDIADTRDLQSIELPPLQASSVKIEILEIRAGAKYPRDICVSELYFD